MISVVDGRLVKIYLVESAEWPYQRLFEVGLPVDERQRYRLELGDRDQWRSTIAQARRAIRSHGDPPGGLTAPFTS
jgi:hypothetical protein